MADPIKEIVRNLTVNFNVKGDEALRMAKSIAEGLQKTGVQMRSASADAKDFGKSMSYMGKAATDANKMLGPLGGSMAFLAGSMTKLSSAAELVAIGLGGQGIINAVRETKQLNTQTLLATNQFKSYGSTITDVQKQMKALKAEYGFTNSQSLSLMRTMEKTFSYKPLSEMTKYAKFLSNAVGDDAEAMEAFSRSVGNASAKMIGLQQMIQRTDKDGRFLQKDIGAIQGNAISLAIAGKISPEEMSDMLSISQAGSNFAKYSQSPGDRREEAEARRYINNANRPEQFINDASVALGKKFTPELQRAADIIKSHGESIVNFTSTLGKYAAYVGTGLLAFQGISSGVHLVRGLLGRGKGGLASAVAGSAGGGGAGDGVRVFVTNMPSWATGGLTGGQSSVGDAATQAAEKLGWFGRGRAGLNARFGPAATGFGGFIGRGGAVGAAGGGALAQAGIGGLVGWGAGEGAEWGISKLTGTAEEGSITASLGGMGTALGAGFLTGGPIGAIAAVLPKIYSSLTASLRVWEDMSRIHAETDDLRKKQSSAYENQKSLLEGKGITTAESDANAAAEKVRKMSEIVDDKRQWYSGWFGGESEAKRNLYAAQNELEEKTRIRNFARGDKNDPNSGDAATKAYWQKQKEQLDSEKKAKEEKAHKVELSKKDLDNMKALVSAQRALNDYLEQQQATLAASTGFYQAQLEIATAMAIGPTTEVASAFNDYMKNLEASNNLIRTQIGFVDQIVKKATDAGAKIGGSADDIAASSKRIAEAYESGNPEKMQQTLADESKTAAGLAALMQYQKQLGTTLVQQETARAKAAHDVLKTYDMSLALKQAEIDQSELQIQIADNLAMGVAASASQRMMQAQKLAAYEDVLRQKKMTAETNLANAIEEQNTLKKAGAPQEAINAAIAAEKQARLDVMQIGNDMLRTDLKRLEVTRALRDGWVSALNAMNNGVGMFQKIMIDKEHKLGTFMAYQPRKVVGLATGFAGRGRTEATRFNAAGVGVLTNPEKADEAFGAGSKEWGRAMDQRTPVGFLGGTGAMNPAGAASGMSMWQDLVGRRMSTAMAGAAGSAFGTSELAEMAKKTAEGVKDGVKSIANPSNPLPVQIIDPNAGKSSGIDGRVLEKLMQDMLDPMVKAFRGVAEAAMNRVMEDLNKGV